ncbi:hypothetical protein ACI0FM_01570 [Paenochrobactrum sp. BZR 588]|uniref:hypothetical protein n=1 Tax=unclassified Paenochrobactrum TaxID=2639760 RepID=UPI0038553141
MTRIILMSFGVLICAGSSLYFYYLSNFWCNAGIFKCLKFTDDWAVSVFYIPTAIGIFFILAGLMVSRKT